MVYNTASGWAVFFCNLRARREIAELPDDLQAEFAKMVGLIQTYGLLNMHEPHVKHLTGKVWELRLKGRTGIARSLYLTAEGKQVVILHSFVKKTQQTPQDALNLALRRAREEGYL